LGWLRGVAAGFAEEFGLDKYSKKIVFEEFLVSWLLVKRSLQS
jgi:phage shock protein PspC (stress-responsive transcriptional regulator)